MPPPPTDPHLLDQILRIQDALLVENGDPARLGVRICQSTALLLRAAAVRLVTCKSDGSLESVAAYGSGEFDTIEPEELRRGLDEQRPVVHQPAADGGAVLTIPLRAGGPPVLLQIRTEASAPLRLEDLSAARFAATLAAVALRNGGGRQARTGIDGAAGEILLTLAHDLRSPLNVLMGYTHMLLEGGCGACTADQREVLATIERQGQELLSLLGEALDLARLEVDALRREEFSVADVLRELSTSSLAHRVNDGVRLAWHADPALPPMQSDRFRLRQILQNLVDNALRFTDQGDVAVAATAYAGGVRLTVSDTGPGIASNDLPHLFEAFRPGATAPQHTRGTGCGLYLVKRFSESLGGSVAVDSAPGGGTRFIVDLPLTL